MDTLELLSIIDIIKNEKLYQKKLDDLRVAEEHLADSRFIAATVEQANKYKEDAAKDKKSATDTLAAATLAIEEGKKTAAIELEELKQTVERKVALAERKATDAQRRVVEIRDLEQKCIKWDQDLSGWSQQLNQKELALKKRENLLNARIEKIKQIMKEEI